MNYWDDINIRALIAFSLTMIAASLAYMAFGRSGKKAHR